MDEPWEGVEFLDDRLFVAILRLTHQMQFTFKREAVVMAASFLVPSLLGLLAALLALVFLP